MSITSQIEDKFHLKIESLNAKEKETYFAMERAVQQSQMTPDKLREYIVSMREAVTKELINEPETKFMFFVNRRQVYLKARLQNYLLLESFLMSPQRAKQQLEDMVAGMSPK